MEKTFEESVAEAVASVSAVSPQEAWLSKQDHPETIFIDPRDLEDIRATTGMIPYALNVPLYELSNLEVNQLPGELTDHTRPIIASCQGGPMGALAAFALKQRGYQNVRYMEGGTQGWLEAGFATTR